MTALRLYVDDQCCGDSDLTVVLLEKIFQRQSLIDMESSRHCPKQQVFDPDYRGLFELSPRVTL